MRIRFSLRTFLIAVSLIGVGLWLGNSVLSFVLAMRAQQYLKSRGIFVGGWNSNEIQWWHYFTERDVYFVESSSATLTTLDWRQIRRLGPICHLAVRGEECESPDFFACLQRNRHTLRELFVIHCELTPQLGTAIGNCPQLEKIVFRNVREGRESFAIQTIPQLQTLLFAESNVGDSNLQWIAHQPALGTLWLPGGARDSVVDSVIACRGIHFLNASSSSISAAGMRRLIAETNLESLRFPAVQLTEADLEAIAGSELKYVDLRTAEIPNSLMTVLQCERITEVEITGDQYEVLVNTDVYYSREVKVRLEVHKLDRYDDIPENPWPDSVRLCRAKGMGRYFLWEPEPLYPPGYVPGPVPVAPASTASP